MRGLIAALCLGVASLAWIIAGSAAKAQQALSTIGPAPAVAPLVVELYTSQGCSSCPPADVFLAELARRDDVIALALHVDYWDYIGWADAFALAANGERQRAYAQVAGEHMVYTPQMIIGGTDHVIGTDTMAVMDAMRRHTLAPRPVSLQVAPADAGLRITAQSAVEMPLRVQLVRYRPEETVEIVGGENIGQRIRYVNIVTGWQTLGDWDGVEPLMLELPLSGADRAVVLVQEILRGSGGATGPGRILAAQELR